MQFGDDGVFKVLVANKSDRGDKVVSDEEGATLARKYSMPFVITSAKTNLNVDKASVHRPATHCD